VVPVGVEGDVDEGFEDVADAFSANFEAQGEVGAAYCLYVEGRKVVDMWAGRFDASTGRPYDEDTLQLVFSTTKGATAACAHLLAQRGLLDLDAKVSTYWPEFAKAGKEDIPVSYLLCHKAGVPTVDARLTFEEACSWEPVVRALEEQAPYWPPGARHGYHALTFGWLVGEVVRRVDGRSIGTFVREEIAEPLGIEFWIGLPAGEEHRVSPIVGAITVAFDLAPTGYSETLTAKALSLNGAFQDEWFNRRETHAAEIAGGAGVTNARSLARFYAGLVGAVPGGPSEALLTRAQIDKARERQTSGYDEVLSFPGLPVESTIGLGFMTSSPFSPYGAAGSFGHAGAGGSVGFADPENQLAAGYVMNNTLLALNNDPRSQALIGASYEAIGADAPYL
jgi:CubicO group peptidase (beta-lactamase class C family)